MTWDLLQHKTGYIAHDKFDEGIRIIVMRGPASWNAYLGIPQEHPLAGYDYDDLPINCHGGLTYSGDSLKNAPAGFWYYGWDYAHCDDAYSYEEKLSAFRERAGTRWTADEVLKEAQDVLWDFKRLVKLAEKVTEKGLGWKNQHSALQQAKREMEVKK